MCEIDRLFDARTNPITSSSYPFIAALHNSLLKDEEYLCHISVLLT